MEQTVVAAPAEHSEVPQEVAQFDKTAMTGWKWFTKFLLWNVIACAAALIFIGIFTVWS